MAQLALVQEILYDPDMIQIADMIQGWMIPLGLQHATKP